MADPHQAHARGHRHHAHGPGHSHGSPDWGRAFLIGVVLNVGFVVAEVAFGLMSGSLALLSDAGHNASDVLGLLLAWGASVLAALEATARRIFGFRRATILAALASAVLLFMPGGPPDDRFRSRVREGLADRFAIGHATLQVERGDERYLCPEAELCR